MREQIPNSLTLDKVLLNEKYVVNYYQREYRWGRKQVEQLIGDLTEAFEDSYNSFNDTQKCDIKNVDKMDFYYMGTIIVTKEEDGKASIIDGQQRLTSLTLLLIALRNLNKQFPGNSIEFEDSSQLIFNSRLNIKSFNINVPQWNDCFNCLIDNKEFNDAKSGESVKTIIRRYRDIVELLTDYFTNDGTDPFDGDLLSIFNSWVRYKTLFIKIETPSEQDAHKVFVSMNDRGLSLNPSEMLKGYLLSEINDDDQRKEANEIWQRTVLQLKQSEGTEFNGEYATEDMNFLSTWIRAKYADTQRSSKKDSKDKDYEIIGREFHEWVRQNHQRIGLHKSPDYYNFIKNKFTFFANQYLRIKKYSKEFTEGYESVFYNADKQVTYQTMLILATLDENDSEETTNTKIKLVSTFADQYSARRIFNFSKFNWNGIKYEMFSTMKSLRGLDLGKLTVYLTQRLAEMDYKIDGITTENFCKNQFTGRYILHILARITDYIEVLMGNTASFPSYINRSTKNTYDREHVLPDKYEDYRDSFSSPDEFKTYRERLGNLILLKLDKNRSYQDMTYKEKKDYYYGDNILAQSFNEKAYKNNPKFINVACKRYPFKSYDDFGKSGIGERQELYRLICKDIYDENSLKGISNSWDDDYYNGLIENKLQNSMTLDVLHGNVENSTSKKPVFIEIDGYKISCDTFVDMVIKVVNFLIGKNDGKMRELAKNRFCGKLFFIFNDAERESIRNNLAAPRETSDTKILIDVHASGKDLVFFVKQLLNQFNVSNAILYLK